MTCSELAWQTACWLQAIYTTLNQPDWLAIASVIVSAVLAGAALWAAIAANRLTKRAVDLTAAANTLAAQAVDLTRRAERRRYADVLQAYFDGRRNAILHGTRMDHLLYVAVMSASNELQEPNADTLRNWTNAVLAFLEGATSRKENPHHDRIALEWDQRVQEWLSIEIGLWTNRPETYSPRHKIPGSDSFSDSGRRGSRDNGAAE